MSSLTFGSDLAGHSAAPLDIAVSDDRLAFTLRYSDFQVELNNGYGSPSLMATRWEWLALPVADGGQGTEMTIAISGYALTDCAAQASLVLSLNGQVMVVGFPPGTDREFVQPIGYLTTGADQEIRLAIGVVVESDSQSGSGASITVSTVDGDIPIEAPPQNVARQASV